MNQNIQLTLQQRDVNFRIVDGEIFLTHSVVGTSHQAIISKQDVKQYRIKETTGVVSQMIDQLIAQVEAIAADQLSGGVTASSSDEVENSPAKRLAEELQRL